MAADAADAQSMAESSTSSAVQIRSGGGQQSPYYAELETAQSNAESSGLGLWSKVQPCGSFDSLLPPQYVSARCAAFHPWPAFTQEKCAMQDESAVRGSVRTVHTVSDDGESLMPFTLALGILPPCTTDACQLCLYPIALGAHTGIKCVLQAWTHRAFCRNSARANQSLPS